MGHFDHFWSYLGGKKSETFWDFLIWRLVRFEDFSLATLEYACAWPADGCRSIKVSVPLCLVLYWNHASCTPM